jgi:nitrate/nitrite-specific signal transduction histidine kinase
MHPATEKVRKANDIGKLRAFGEDRATPFGMQALRSDASSATSSLNVDRKSAHRVELRVSDNGQGVDPDTVQPGHRGLSIIRERACAMGSDPIIGSQPAQGTEIVVRWEERQ